MVHRNNKLQAVMTIPVTNSKVVEWSDNIHFFKLKQPPRNNSTNINRALADRIDQALENPGNRESMLGVASALTKVADTMNKDMELKLSEKKEEKQKSTYKNFNALSHLTQTILCTASAYVTTPDDNKYNSNEEGQQITILTNLVNFFLRPLPVR